MHQKRIFHRDIKPQNIVLTLKDGKIELKIVDLGIAYDGMPDPD